MGHALLPDPQRRSATPKRHSSRVRVRWHGAGGAGGAAPGQTRTHQHMASNIVVPEVGESIVDARIAKWLRHEGDVVAAGDPLVELETDKIDLEVSAPQAGVLAKISRQDGEDVKVGEVLGVIEDAGAAAGSKPESAAKPAPAAKAAAAAPAVPAKVPRATPTARKAAEER